VSGDSAIHAHEQEPAMTEASYDVVLLVEQPLSDLDARQVRGLHESVEDPVRYHLLLPVEDAAARVESTMGSLAASEVLAAPVVTRDPAAVENMQHELLERARADVNASMQRLMAAGGTGAGEVVAGDPMVALAEKVTEVGAAEVIVLTRPHIVAEFFHLDWSSRARRKLGVPVLHLLEQENFDEQAEGYGSEGITGL
jgi:hypothetical protein